MRSHIASALLAFALSSPTHAPRAGCMERVPTHNADERALVALENEWCDAAIKRDARRLDRVFADDARWITDTGYWTKAEIIDHYVHATATFAFDVTGVRILVFGSGAVVTSHVHVTKTENGKTTTSDHTSTDVFVKRAGRWLCIST